MPITVNNSASSNLDPGGLTITFPNYNVSAGTAGTRKLCFTFQTESDDRVVSAATFNGSSFTEAGNISVGSGAGYNYGTIWYLDDADIGVGGQTSDLVITLDGVSTKAVAFVFWLDDVAQGVPTQTATDANAAAGLTSFSVDIFGVALNSIVINAFGVGDDVSPLTPDGAQTKVDELAEGTMRGAAAYEIPGSGDRTLGWTFPAARRPNIVLAEWPEYKGQKIYNKNHTSKTYEFKEN